MSINIGDIITEHEKEGYKEIYTGVEYFKLYAMDRSYKHNYKYDFVVTDSPSTEEREDLSPLKMLVLVRNALNGYMYTVFDDGEYFDDFLNYRPFEKSMSINAKVLFLLPRTRKEDLYDRGIEGIYHFYINGWNDSDNFVSNKWVKTPEIKNLRFATWSLESDKPKQEYLDLLKRDLFIRGEK